MPESFGHRPRLYAAYWGLGIAYWQKGLFEEAVAAYERAVDLEPSDLWVKGDLALVYAAAGKRARAQQILEEFEEKAQREYVLPLALVLAHMAVGDLDGTFAWLDKVYEDHHAELIWMNRQPRYDPLRGDPRWRELMRKIGFTEAQIDAANALAAERGAATAR